MLGFTERDVELLIPLAGIFFVFGFPVLAWLIHRLLAYRERQMKYLERIEMIRHGINPGVDPTAPNGGSNPTADEWRAWAGSPQGSRPAGQPTISPAAAASAQQELRKGMMLVAVGLALTIGLSYVTNHPGPWLIAGFIPLFIGLARVALAMTSGAQMRFGQPPYVPPPPPQQPPPSDPKNVTYEGSYTYRPGSAQELRPPRPPPTTRDK